VSSGRARARVWLAAGAVLFAAASWSVVPPATATAPRAAAATDVAIGYHVHTTRSDGTGSRDEVARAAARAGVRVVVLTDHGDATRAADPPAYIDGVLVLDAVEISTWGGHYVALGAAPAPYPLGGEPRAAVEDVGRLGGVGLVAHPGSSRPGLRWRDWDAPFDGLEWLNADSEWRDQPGRLWRTALAYPWRPVEALASLVDRPAFELEQWDRLIARRPVVGLAALDAHARLGVSGVGEPYEGWVALDLPSYTAMFGSLATYVRLATPLSGGAAADAAAVVDALRAGRSFSAVTGIAPIGQLTFEAESGGRRATMGEQLVPQGPVHVRFAADVPTGTQTRLVCDGTVVAEGPGGRLDWTSDGVPGACRAEVQLARDGRVQPWLVTNPIYARAVLDTVPPLEATTATVVGAVPGGERAAAWTIEAAPDATATVADDPAGGVRFEWRLGGAAQTFAAMRLEAPADLRQFDSLLVRAAADRPMRVSLQVRVPGGDGQRWGRSLYLDGTAGEYRVPFMTMLPLGLVDDARPPLGELTAVLLVVDTVHAPPGSAGRITLAPLRLAR
jgi:hypothetical protein